MQSQKKLIITNNPMVYNAFNGKHLMIYDEKATFGEVLVRVRDNIHAGRRLLTHPLSGSIKPFETPYKTVLLSQDAGELDTDGLSLIEDSIITARKFESAYEGRKPLPQNILEDFQLVDFNLIEYIVKDY